MSARHDSKSSGKKQSEETGIVQLVLQDHQTVKDLYKKIQSGHDATSEKLFQKMCWEIALHAVSEELILYPLQESMDKEGKQLAKESREDHEKTKAALQELDGKMLKEPGVREKVDLMMKDLLEHMEKEETEDLVKLENGLSKEKLMVAGHDFQQAKSLIPAVASSDQSEDDARVEKSEKDSHFKTPMSLLLADKEKLQAIIGEHSAKESVSVNKTAHKEESHADHGKKTGSSKSHDGHDGDKSNEGHKSHAVGEQGYEGGEIPYNLRHRDEKGHVVPDEPEKAAEEGHNLRHRDEKDHFAQEEVGEKNSGGKSSSSKDKSSHDGDKSKAKSHDGGHKTGSHRGESHELGDVEMGSEGQAQDGNDAGDTTNGRHKHGNGHGKRAAADGQEAEEPTSYKKSAGTRTSGQHDRSEMETDDGRHKNA